MSDENFTTLRYTDENDNVVEYNIHHETISALEHMGPYTWCITLMTYPMLAQLCDKWSEMMGCGHAWQKLINQHPNLCAYAIVAI